MAGSMVTIYHPRLRLLGRQSARYRGGPSPTMINLVNPRSKLDKKYTMRRGERSGFGGSSHTENHPGYTPDDYTRWPCGHPKSRRGIVDPTATVFACRGHTHARRHPPTCLEHPPGREVAHVKVA
jgi:hypothetical protein